MRADGGRRGSDVAREQIDDTVLGQRLVAHHSAGIVARIPPPSSNALNSQSFRHPYPVKIMTPGKIIFPDRASFIVVGRVRF